jgi:predicted dithiol-disulfide oxidoreductase (DUF899 family)
MSTTIDTLVAPGASDEYRRSRERLLTAEKQLMEQVEAVAAMRRALPLGPEVPDYEFDGPDGRVRLSQLFDPKREPYLVMYHLMYWADDDEFCPMCSGWIDALNAVAPHLEQRINFAVASLVPAQRLQAWARQRGWDNAVLLADIGTQLADAIGARTPEGEPDSTVAVFAKDGTTLRHLYTAHPGEHGSTYNGIDLLNPVWHAFDLTPAGRGEFNLRNDYLVPA